MPLHHRRVCVRCADGGGVDTAFQRCARCKCVKYCSKECQRTLAHAQGELRGGLRQLGARAR